MAVIGPGARLMVFALAVVAVLVFAESSPAMGRDPVAFVDGLHRAALSETAQLAAPHAAAATAIGRVVRRRLTFYVDAVRGTDANLGTSPQRPWRTLARVDRGSYRGGDAILLHGGERFAGTLRFSPMNVVATSSSKRLAIGSYGVGRPVIAAADHSGLVVYDVTGVRVFGLELVGTDRSCHRQTDGVLFDARGVGRTLAAGIAVDHVDVHGFCDGIVIGSDDDRSGIAHVVIDAVTAHDNGDAGVATYDQALKQHKIRDVRVTRTEAYRNANEGGILMFGVDGAVVDRSVAYGNGAHASGAVGIWAFDANGVVLEHDESYGNLTVGTDGDGFDLDGGVTNSVMEYDYSHDNAGIGFLVCACVGWYFSHHDVVRYNISQNDGSSGQASGIYVGGGTGFSGVDVLANTVYSGSGGGPIVQVDGASSSFSHVHFANNVFVAAGGKPLLHVVPAGARDLTFQGNDWWSTTGRFAVQWGARRFGSLVAWRTATRAEMLGGHAVGISTDPRLCAPGHGGTVYPRAVRTLTAYRLAPGSPLAGAGVDLAGLFAADAGTLDFAGEPAPSSAGYAVGAEEADPDEKC